MYKIEKFYLPGAIFIQNHSKMILSFDDDKKKVSVYEKSIKPKYKLIHQFEICPPNYFIWYAFMLSNDLILISGRRFIIIYKKINEKYSLHQEIFKSDWAEIINIKELKNGNFASCGWHGFTSFKQKNSSDKFEIDYEIEKSLLNDYWIIDFMEIKDKINSFILCGRKRAFIINDKNVINQINFNEGINYKSIHERNYICQFNDEIFIFSTAQIITLVNIRENKFKQTNLLEETNEKRKSHPLPDDTLVYKYDINSIIILTSLKGIFIVQIFDKDIIQVNTRIKIGKDYYYKGYLIFIKEEKSIYYKNKKSKNEKVIYKLKFIKK